MAINYQKVGWDTTKYFNPTNMNHMDDGIKAACDKADANEAAIADVNNKLGNTDISSIGDGTLTGGLDALNSNLIKKNIAFLFFENSGNVISTNAVYYANGVYHIDASIQLNKTINNTGTVFSLIHSGYAITFANRLDALLEGINGNYQIYLAAGTNYFQANGYDIPAGLYKIKMEIVE